MKLCEAVIKSRFEFTQQGESIFDLLQISVQEYAYFNQWHYDLWHYVFNETSSKVKNSGFSSRALRGIERDFK
jgi:hypothetical protein